MTVLVTGAQGYIGRYTVAALLKSGNRVIGTGRSVRVDGTFTHTLGEAKSRRVPLPGDLRRTLEGFGQYEYRQCDLADADQVAAMVSEVTPTHVIHLAAALRDENWSTLLASNLHSTVNLLNALARLPVRPTVVIASSGSIYGNQAHQPIGENALPRPIGAYATTKLMAELAGREIAREAGMSVAIARIFNVIGPGLQTRHLPGLLAHAIAEHERLGIPARLQLGDLSAVRHFIDVRDVADCLAESKGWAGVVCVNLASQVAPVSRVVEAFGGRASVCVDISQNLANGKVGADSMRADVSLMSALYTPCVSFDQSIDDMLAFARSV